MHLLILSGKMTQTNDRFRQRVGLKMAVLGQKILSGKMTQLNDWFCQRVRLKIRKLKKTSVTDTTAR